MGSRIETAQTLSDLFQPVQLGCYQLANHIVMASLTRGRAGEHGIPGALIAAHYARRASAGLIISEGVNISPTARGHALTPGIYDDAQVEGWRRVTEGVHARGGRIFPQLWHVGRVSHPSLHSPAACCRSRLRRSDQMPPPIPRPASSPARHRAPDSTEIPAIIDRYRRAAQNALDLARRQQGRSHPGMIG
ncbi:hypothetical protein [Caballeronia sp. dw_19]|uniref:oxidoreductase n=1 Tax=Caballeronia sp. dw_19 TaxID=2719791 RepID=UPI001BD555CC|nr:hypothetical protein [Caballeronia sp. dw_19]